jgi:hypothetical protein
MTGAEKERKYINACEVMAQKVNPILNKIFNKIERVKDKLSDDDSEVYEGQGCGGTKIAPVMTEREKEVIREINTNVIADIENNPYKYPEIQPTDELSNEGGSGGQGDSKYQVRIKSVPYPKWLDALDGAISKNVYTRSKIRKGLDLEEALKNSIRKQKTKGVTFGNKVIVLMDTSGSMFMGGKLGDSGFTFLEKLVAYLPHVANKYDGQLWYADDCPEGATIPLQKITELKTLTPKYMESNVVDAVTVSGGGGSDFWGAYQMYHAQLAKARETKPDAEMTLVFMTDCGFDWKSHPNLIPENLILLTTKQFAESKDLPNLLFKNRQGKKRKIIYMR